jgi:hypothetical protein
MAGGWDDQNLIPKAENLWSFPAGITGRDWPCGLGDQRGLFQKEDRINLQRQKFFPV